MLLCMVLAVGCLALPGLCQTKFDVVVNFTSDHVDVSVTVDQSLWLLPADIFFQCNGKHYSSSGGGLQPGSKSQGKGQDSLGMFTTTQWEECFSGKNCDVELGVRKYTHLPVAIFSQEYKAALNGTSVGSMNKVISGFPAFSIGSDQRQEDVGYLFYSDLFLGSVQMKTGVFKTGMKKLPDGLLSGPMLLFDKMNNAMVISPFNHFMAASLWHDNVTDSINWGIMGDVKSVPQGYIYETIMVYSNEGINKAVELWGEVMRSWYHRDTAARDHDITVTHLGYYTDAGAYYYHHTEPNMTYEEILLKTHSLATSQGIPYRYFQYDDWWYKITGSGYGATVTWEPMSSVFPRGLRYLYNETRMPVIAHNRYWSSKTTYAKQNGGQYNFLMDGEKSIPDDQSFWDYLFGEAKEWGLVNYEQDFLCTQVETITPLHTDLGLGERWMHQMGEAAHRYGLWMQYCMALPRHLMASLEIPVVSHARASSDYRPSSNNWKIGITSMFAHAMGVAPFKDNFWTTTNQPGNPYNLSESNPLLPATVALLSTGPVGVSDRLGLSNASLIRKLHREDGLLLKTERPAMPIDSQLLQAAFGGSIGPVGEVWTTCTIISFFHFGIIFSGELKGSYSMNAREIGYAQDYKGAIMTYSYDSASSVPQKYENFQLEGCTYNKFCLHYTSQIIPLSEGYNVLILGEQDKMVPVSPKRTKQISVHDEELRVLLEGVPGEQVTYRFYLYSPQDAGTLVSIACTINQEGTTTVRLNAVNKACY